MNRGGKGSRIRTQALGLVFLLVIGALGWLSIAIYAKTFSSSVPVTLIAERVGNQLPANADVKARGVVVGSVRQVRVIDGGAEIELAMDPDLLGELPSNITARLLPKSVFGQRFVNLIFPERPERPLAAGDVIVQDASGAGVELEQLLNDMMPLLQAVQPQKLAASIGAAAQALDGRGDQLGGTIVRLNSYLKQLNPHLPQLQEDIATFADVLTTYNSVGADVIDALDDFATTSRTIAERRQDIAEMLVTVTAAANGLEDFLRPNSDTLDALLANSRPILALLAQHSARWPCLFGTIAKLKPLVEKALGKGTGEPGLHVELRVKRPGAGGKPRGLPCD